MPTVIKAGDPQRVPRGASFNFDDMAQQAQAYLKQVREQAEQIVAQARADAEGLRQRAEREGRAAGERAIAELVERQVARQMETLLPAMSKAIHELEESRHAWLMHWEQRAIHVATAIAARVVRRLALATPQITLSLVKEALELASGSAQIRLHLNPADHQALGQQVQQIIGQLARVSSSEVIADPAIEPGGCRVETKHGAIDQQFATQLARIEAELT